MYRKSSNIYDKRVFGQNTESEIEKERVHDKYDFARYINIVAGGKELPQLYTRKEDCCGCAACYSICPMSGKQKNAKNQKIIINERDKTTIMQSTGAITMVPDEEGFLYPVVDASVCIRCYKCLEVCGFKKAKTASML